MRLQIYNNEIFKKAFIQLYKKLTAMVKSRLFLYFITFFYVMIAVGKYSFRTFLDERRSVCKCRTNLKIVF